MMMTISDDYDHAVDDDNVFEDADKKMITMLVLFLGPSDYPSCSV